MLLLGYQHLLLAFNGGLLGTEATASDGLGGDTLFQAVVLLRELADGWLLLGFLFCSMVDSCTMRAP